MSCSSVETGFERAARGFLLAALLISLQSCNRSAAQPEAQADGLVPTGSYVANGDFETAANGGTLPAGWFRNIARTGDKGRVELVEEDVPSGRRALMIVPNESNDSTFPISVAQEIEAGGLSGREIVLSANVRAMGGASAIVGLMHESRGVQSDFAIIAEPGTDGQWRYHELVYRVPDDPDVRLFLSLWSPGRTGAVWFDGVSLRMNEPPDAAFPAESLDAAIFVDAGVVRRIIPPTLFGANVEWRWNATSLWREDRRDVDPAAQRLADEMGVTLLRYPGGIYSDHYHWRDGVGPYEDRPEVSHEPGKPDRSTPNFGTDEALRLAEEIGAELLITVNITTGTAEEAADWVRYVNRDTLRVRYWEIGNEQYLDTGTAVTDAATMSPSEYSEKAIEFARAMKAADPRIQIGLIGGLNEGSYQQMSYPRWNEIVIGAAGEYADFLSVHNAYAPVLTGDERGRDLRTVYEAMLGRPAAISRNLDRLSEQLDSLYPAGTERPFIAVTEWGPIFQFFNAGEYVDHAKTLGSALFVASTLRSFVESEATEVAAFWMLNDFGVLGWIASANDTFPPSPEWAPTARYYAFQMFSRHFGSRLLGSRVVSPSYDSTRVGWSDGETDIPYLESTAALNEDGSRLHIIVINKHFDSPIQGRIELASFVPRATASGYFVSGTGIDANTGTKPIAAPNVEWGTQARDGPGGRFAFGAPDEVWMRPISIENAAEVFTYTFPPHSITSLELTRQ